MMLETTAVTHLCGFSQQPLNSDQLVTQGNFPSVIHLLTHLKQVTTRSTCGQEVMPNKDTDIRWINEQLILIEHISDQ